ncbi:MAG: hypothetical protein PWQ20_1072 [Thermotogaceae bacterium]|jgi:small-conductance mechanosensitive channel|nr:hypothetical protein [Thermotogaceae bacterium]MDN5338002.1 hypothetical protein [Thermotogaceae bacterium]
MQDIINFIHETTGIDPANQLKILKSIIAIVIIIVIRAIILKIIFRRTIDVKKRYFLGKISIYIASIVGTLIILRIWFKGFGSIGTFLGLLSAGLAIASRDIIMDFFGWIFIIVKRPFKLGDRIQIGELRGDVIDTNILQFTLLEIGNWVDAEQSTGRVVYVPNSMVFNNPIANYVAGFEYIWNEIPVLITFESNWKKAKEILTEIAQRYAEKITEHVRKQIIEASKKYMIFYSKLTPIVYTKVESSGILLTIRYLCKPKNRRNTEQAIWENILEEFARHKDIDFAYQTIRYYNNLLEGKSNKQNVEKKLDTGGEENGI